MMMIACLLNIIIIGNNNSPWHSKRGFVAAAPSYSLTADGNLLKRKTNQLYEQALSNIGQVAIITIKSCAQLEKTFQLQDLHS